MFSRLSKFLYFAWHMIGVNRRLLFGMWKLTKLPQPAVTFFGGSRLKIDSPEGKKATMLAQELAQCGFSIITGGGPGIMEAANRGALAHCTIEKNCDKNLSSFGIGLTRLNNEKINPHVQEHILMEYFFERKWLLVRYSVAFVVFPGGFGTLDELSEVLTLIQCDRMPNTPVILVGTEYWNPMKEWMTNCMLKNDFLLNKDLDIFVITDDIQEACKLIETKCKKHISPSFSE
ncbi:TIGR00730 family Rossman fold protein [Candidatus Babeliales bacterium]|nr:TIGR00730 family Rossman fold protein [Candidatus Babeliales bacterium]